LAVSCIFGDKALSHEVLPRDYTAKALETTYCLSLNRLEFLDKTFFFEHNQKSKRMNYLQKLDFTKNWHPEKMTHFNSELSQKSYLPNEIIFDIGE